MCGAFWIDVGEFPQTVRRVARVNPMVSGASELPPAVYPLAVDNRADHGVHSGGLAGQATILAPSPNLALTRIPMAS